MVAVLRKDIMRHDDRAYHAKGLDAPAKYAPTLEVRKGQCTVWKRLEKVWVGGSVNFRILTLVRRTHHLLSVTLNLIGGSQRDRYPEEECMGVWLSLRILDSWYVSVLEYSNPPEVSDPSSS